MQTLTLQGTPEGRKGRYQSQRRKQQRRQPEAHQHDKQWRGRQEREPCAKWNFYSKNNFKILI